MNNKKFAELLEKEISILKPVQKLPINNFIVRLLYILFKRLISMECNKLLKQARIEIDVLDSKSHEIIEKFYLIDFIKFKVREL